MQVRGLQQQPGVHGGQYRGQWRSAGHNTLQVLCSTTQCVLDPATVRGLGAGLGAGLGWWPLTSPNTSRLWGHSLGEAATGLLGTAEPGAMVLAPVQV